MQQLLARNEAKAISYARRAIRDDPVCALPHQNLAARADSLGYFCKDDPENISDQEILRDLCNMAGEHYLHLGERAASLHFFGRALRIQHTLSEKMPIPEPIRERLRDLHAIPVDEPVRILPFEWTTRIGHIGCLDSYIRMKKLGYLPEGHPILLPHPYGTANPYFLSLWSKYITVIQDAELVRDLYRYQRACGETFLAALSKENICTTWDHQATLANIEWDQRRLGPLIGLPEKDRAIGRELLATMGIPHDAWWVALHVRSGEFHRDSPNPRNARIKDYYPAIEEITKRGGWVIRLGDTAMPRLPSMTNVVDLAHHPHKSAFLDTFVCSDARFMIGTISGMFYVPVSFGTPLLLTNCFTNWWLNVSHETRILTKIILEPDGQPVSLSRHASEAIHSKLTDSRHMLPEDYKIVDNGSKEIRDATVEMLEETSGMNGVSSCNNIGEWARALGDRPIFGPALPSASFATRHAELVG